MEANIFKPKFIILSIKKTIIPALFCIFTIMLVIFSKSNLYAAKFGLILWANNVVPSLLPFFIATELLSSTNIIFKIEKLLNRFMRPIFNVPGCGAYAFLMGIISGYPIGAKIATQFRKDGLCTKEESERLIAFTNNSGPLFIIATVGISLFGNTTIGLLLFITHILSSITVGVIFRFWKYKVNNIYSTKKTTFFSNYKTANFSNLGEILSKSIMSAITTVIMIGGFVVLFSVIISILNNSGLLNLLSNILNPLFSMFGINDTICSSIISGMIELTNGLQLISSIPNKCISINIIIASFLLGFGGLSIMLQVLSITSKSDISIKPYILGKLLQGLIAAFYTFIFIYNFPIFNFNL